MRHQQQPTQQKQHFNMSKFTYKNGSLHAENVSLTALAEQYGTPLYVYSKAAFSQHFLEFQNALGDWPHLVCYAVKANSNLAVLNVLAKLGAGFDIVSVGELERVIAAGGDPKKAVFSGVGKQSAEMKRALEVGVYCFNVESEAELERLSRVATELQIPARVSLRVNPDVDAQTHPYISTGLKDNKFGIDILEAPEIYARASAMPGINIQGVDCHIGSQLTNLTPFQDALERILQLVDTLEDNGIPIQHIDLGGGLGVRYQSEQAPSPGEYIEAILAGVG